MRDLERAIQLGSGFQLVVVECDSVAKQREAMRVLWPRTRYRVAHIDDADRPVIDQVVEQVGRGTSPVMVTGLEHLAFPGAEELGMWQNLNVTRPRWPRELPRTVVFWVTEDAHRLLAMRAPDLYRFRSTSIDLQLPKSTEGRRLAELRRRIRSVAASPATRLRWFVELWRQTGEEQALFGMLAAVCLGGGSLPDDCSEVLSKQIWIDLGGTLVSDISPLAGLTALRLLDLNHTPVSDVSPLSGLTDLRGLAVGGSLVSDVAPLARLTALQSLWLWNTRVSDVSALSGLRELLILALSNTPVSDVSPLSGLTKLKMLFLNDTQVSDVSPLIGLTALQTLNLRDTQVSDVSPLLGLPSLTQVTLPDGTEWHPQQGPPSAKYLP